MRNLITIGITLSLYVTVAHAQGSTGWVAGRVYDAHDSRPLEGIRVSIQRLDGRGAVETSTDDSGGYRFLALRAGDYRIRFAATNYHSVVVGGVTVQIGRVSLVDVAMKNGDQDQNGNAIERWIGRPINPWGTDYGTVFDRHRLENLPSPRNVWALLETQEPSSVANRVDEGGIETGVIGLVGVQGGSSWTQNIYSLEGLNITDPYEPGRPLLYPDFGSLQEFQASTAVHSSEEQSSAASFNMTTRQGGAKVHAQGEAYYLGKPLQSSNLSPGLRDFGFQTTPHFKRLGEGQLDLGGPVPVTKEWSFFSSLGLQHLSKMIPGFSGAPTASVSSGLLRIDGSVRSKDQAAFIVTGQTVKNSNVSAGGGVSRSVTLRANDRFEVAQGHWTHRQDSETIWDFGLGLSRASLGQTFQACGASANRIQLLAFETSGPAPIESGASRTRISLVGKVQTWRRFPTEWRHLLSFGVDIENSHDFESVRVYEDTQLIFFPNDVPSEVVEYNTPSNTKQRVGAFSLFFEDHLQVSTKLFVHFGLTLDNSTASNPSQMTPAGAFAPVRRLGAAGGVVRWTTFAPQVGIAIPVFGHTADTRLLASFSRYPHTLPAQYAEFANPNSLGGRVYDWVDRNRDRQFQAGEAATLLRVFGGPYSSVDPKLQRPYTDELTLGLESTFYRRIIASLRLLRRDSRQLINRVNVGVPASAYMPVRILDPGDDFKAGTGDDQFLTVYNQDPKTLGHDRFMLTNPAGLTATYEGLEAVIGGGLFRDWGLSFSFSAFKAKGSTNPGNSEFRNDPGVIGSLFDDPNNLLNSRGRVFFDRAYVGKIVAYGRAPFGFHLGSVVSYYDGLPFGRELIVTGLNQGPILVMAKPRNYRTQFNLTFDQRLSRDFEIGRQRLSFFLDGFNVLNLHKSLMESALSGPLFSSRVPLSVENPRVIRLGIRWTL